MISPSAECLATHLEHNFMRNIKLHSPLITVITIALNADKYIEQTIRSVLGQTYKNIEYILVDGGSTDRTVEIINKYKNNIAHFISEKDEGIADAMNKGLAMVTGDYFLFLHSDDYFYKEKSLENALEFMDQTTDILACNILFGKNFKTIKPRGFNLGFNFKVGISHQGALCRRSLIVKLNGFDKQFKICMDYDFFIRAYRKKAKLVKAPVTLAVMRDTGISSRTDWKSLKTRFNEEKIVHKKNCPSVIMKMVYEFYWFLYCPYRYIHYIIKKKPES
jgi:glycosyltransferase involved in cell wall biosynthesis